MNIERGEDSLISPRFLPNRMGAMEDHTRTLPSIFVAAACIMFCVACDLPGVFDAAALSDAAAIAATHMPIFGMTPHMHQAPLLVHPETGTATASKSRLLEWNPPCL